MCECVLCLFFSSAAVAVAVIVGRDGRHTCQPHHHMIAAAAAAGAAAVVVMVSGRDRVGRLSRCVFVCVVAVFCMVCRGVLGGGSCVGGSAMWCGNVVWRYGVERCECVCLCLFCSSAAVVVARDGRHTYQPHHHT